jgi:hypothetical protein
VLGVRLLSIGKCLRARLDGTRGYALNDGIRNFPQLKSGTHGARVEQRHGARTASSRMSEKSRPSSMYGNDTGAREIIITAHVGG